MVSLSTDYGILAERPPSHTVSDHVSRDEAGSSQDALLGSSLFLRGVRPSLPLLVLLSSTLSDSKNSEHAFPLGTFGLSSR